MIDLSDAHMLAVGALDTRAAIVRLLSDPDGPLAGCEASPDDAPAAYMLGTLFRSARAAGILRNKPLHEAVELFANRVRTATRRALDPFDWMVKIAVQLGLRWESLSESDRVWWRGAARDLTRGPDGVSLTTCWTKLRQPARLNDLITSARIAADWISALREFRKDRDTEVP